QFGFEAVNTHSMPIYSTSRMADFLRANGPWSMLVQRSNIDLKVFEPGKEFALPETAGDATVKPILVPHRDQFSDTVAFVIRRDVPAARSIILYVPDTEPWDRWPTPLPTIINQERVNVLIVDGTFFAASDLRDRDTKSIGHPLMVDTMELLASRVRDKSL